MTTLVDIDLSSEDILEGNKSILDFINIDKKEHYGGYMYLYLGKEYTDLFFHSSMEWLFPVIDNLERLGYNISISGTNEDGKLIQRCQIQKGTNNIALVEGSYKITTSWKAVSIACKLHEQTNKSKLKTKNL